MPPSPVGGVRGQQDINKNNYPPPLVKLLFPVHKALSCVPGLILALKLTLTNQG